MKGTQEHSLKHSREQQEHHWQEILKLSVKMRESAEMRDWNSLHDAIEQRENLFTAYFRDETTKGEITKKMAQIEKLQKIDKEVLELTNNNKQLLAKEIVKLQQGKNRLAAYAAGQPDWPQK